MDEELRSLCKCNFGLDYMLYFICVVICVFKMDYVYLIGIVID